MCFKGKIITNKNYKINQAAEVNMKIVQKRRCHQIDLASKKLSSGYEWTSKPKALNSTKKHTKKTKQEENNWTGSSSFNWTWGEHRPALSPAPSPWLKERLI